jgi:hypothetical protein
MVLLEVSGCRAMHVPTVPDQNDLPTHVSVQFGQEPSEVFGSDIVRKQLTVEDQTAERGCQRDGSDSGNPVMTIPGCLAWRVACQRPGATTDRLEHEAYFIEKGKC